jgi:hypothetical protein
MARKQRAIEMEAIDRGWRVHAPKLPGCEGMGATPEEALRAFLGVLVRGRMRGDSTELRSVVNALMSGEAMALVTAPALPRPRRAGSRRSAARPPAP